jgi:hypothetical protein
VRLLLESGADPLIINREGKMAKELTDDNHIIKLIEEYFQVDIKEPNSN